MVPGLKLGGFQMADCIPEAGEPVFLVIVRCSCPDRWWAQPEGSTFPLCRTCGEEAKWIGHEDGMSFDEHRVRRVRDSLGIAGHVLGEFAALRATDALTNRRSAWEETLIGTAEAAP